MPVYDLRCEECEEVALDEFIPLSEYGEPIECECGGSMVRIPAPVATVGPTWSKPVHMGGINRTFTSQKEIREFEKSTDMGVYSQNDSQWRKFKDRTREKADRAARRHGYDDHDHRSKVVRKEKSRKQVLTAGQETSKKYFGA